MEKTKYINKFNLLSGYDTSKTLNENLLELKEWDEPKLIKPELYDNLDDFLKKYIDMPSTGDSGDIKFTNLVEYCKANREKIIQQFKPTLSTEQIRTVSRRISTGIAFLGTREQAVYDALGNIKTLGDFAELVYSYESNYGNDLASDITGDFRQNEMGKIIGAIQPAIDNALGVVFNNPEANINPETPEGYVKPEAPESYVKPEVNAEPVNTSQQYHPCTDYPLTYGCMNGAIQNIQKCLGFKPDGMFGPKTMAGIKGIIPNFNGEITQEVYNTIIGKCKENINHNIEQNSNRRYFPCNDFPFSIGCKNQSIKNIQKCVGVKVDGLYGHKTMAGIKGVISDFNGEITQEVYNTIIGNCDKSVQNESLSLSKLMTL